LIFLLILIFGLIVGSFVGAYTYRWPRGISISEGRSKCPRCKTVISWYDNIPLLSFILLKGKCRKCGKKISLRYPLIEFSTAFIFILVYLNFSGFAANMQNPSLTQMSTFLVLAYYFLISAALVIIFVIDLEHKLIPDEVTFFIFTLSFFNLILTSNEKFYEILLSAFLTSSFFLFLNLVTLGRGMGLGDVKLVLASSLVLADYKLIITFIFLSFFIGSIIGIFLILIKKAKFGKQIPFAPFLITSLFITIMWGDKLSVYLLPYLK